jgi:hypothetical protein
MIIFFLGNYTFSCFSRTIHVVRTKLLRGMFLQLRIETILRGVESDPLHEGGVSCTIPCNLSYLEPPMPHILCFLSLVFCAFNFLSVLRVGSKLRCI